MFRRKKDKRQAVRRERQEGGGVKEKQDEIHFSSLLPTTSIHPSPPV